MLISLLIILLISSALILRRDKSNLFTNCMSTVCITILFKLPLIFGFKLINPYFVPLIVGLSSCLFLIFNICLSNKSIKNTDIYLCIITFILSFTGSLLLMELTSYISPHYLVGLVHNHLSAILGLTGIILPSFILFADSVSGNSDSIVGTSGYEGGSSRSVSTTVPAGEEKLQFGAIVSGLSYSSVCNIKSQIHSIVVQQLTREGPVITVGRVLESCHPRDGPGFRKVMEKAYSLTDFKFNHDSVLAMVNFPKEDGSLSINYSKPMQKILDLTE